MNCSFGGAFLRQFRIPAWLHWVLDGFRELDAKCSNLALAGILFRASSKVHSVCCVFLLLCSVWNGQAVIYRNRFWFCFIRTFSQKLSVFFSMHFGEFESLCVHLSIGVASWVFLNVTYYISICKWRWYSSLKVCMVYCFFLFLCSASKLHAEFSFVTRRMAKDQCTQCV